MTSAIGGEFGEFVELTLPGIDEGEILVIRSKRRKKSISAYRQGGRIVISIPARLSKADEKAIVPEMIAKIRSQEADITPGEAGLANDHYPCDAPPSVHP